MFKAIEYMASFRLAWATCFSSVYFPDVVTTPNNCRCTFSFSCMVGHLPKWLEKFGKMHNSKSKTKEKNGRENIIKATVYN